MQFLSTPQQKTCIVTLGNTGLGKSTLINIFCNGVACVSSAAHSETKECEFFDDTTETSRIWMDTRGWDDSHGLDDDVTRRKIMHKLYEEEITDIKVVWFVPPSTRSSGSLSHQARFITDLAMFSSNGDRIWESVLLVMKKADLEPDEDDLQGAVEAARACGAESVKSVGYTALNHFPGKDGKKKQKKAKKKSDEERVENGWLYDHEIRDEIIPDLLKELLPIRLTFEQKRCRKCGIVGDERCVPRGCHTFFKWVHEFEHKSAQDYCHPKELQATHIRVCPQDHKIQAKIHLAQLSKMANDMQKENEKRPHCKACQRPFEFLYWCDTCEKAFCGEQSSVDWSYRIVQGAALVLGGFAVYSMGPVAVSALTAGSAMNDNQMELFVNGCAGVMVGGYQTVRMLRGVKCTRIVPGYLCCDRREDSVGCSYKCCCIKIGKSDGCVRVCNECDQPWQTHDASSCLKGDHEFDP